MNWTEIIVAFIGLVGIGVTAYFGYLSKRRTDARMGAVETEVDLHRFALSFDDFFREWQGIEEDLHKLFQDTNIERFLLLRAFNGKHEPRWTNAIFQLRSGGAKDFVDYKFVELDEDYIARLKKITNENKLTVEVESAQEGLIKSIYLAESIKHSSWFHIASYDAPEGSRMITYCSFATTKDEPIDKGTEIRCQLIANKFKLIADSLIPLPSIS